MSKLKLKQVCFLYSGNGITINFNNDMFEDLKKNSNDMIDERLSKGFSLHQQIKHYKKQCRIYNSNHKNSENKNSINEHDFTYALNVLALLKMKAIPNNNNNGIKKNYITN